LGANSRIEWTHHTFNPWWGCVRVSPACQHCYAETFAKRVGQDVWGVDKPRRFFGDKHWAEPVKWNAEAARAGERARVFCASMADVFELHGDPATHSAMQVARQRLWRLIETTPMLDWLLLTKRPENIRDLTPGDWDMPRPNVWFGTTVEDEARKSRIAALRAVPAAVRFLSCEPLLGPLHFAPGELNGIGWVIVGGESGPGSRPMAPEWADSVRRVCQHAGIAFHFKQWGDWRDGARIGKKLAGRVLHGQTWDELPPPAVGADTAKQTQETR
jgi:protein gp37